MQDVEATIAKLLSVKQLGVRIAIDDFGTGYSSLAYLTRLPVETLKIDRSFVIRMLEDANTMTLVQTVISLAHSLRLRVVAEGVDAEEQAKMLRLLGCESEMQVTCSASRCRSRNHCNAGEGQGLGPRSPVARWLVAGPRQVGNTRGARPPRALEGIPNSSTAKCAVAHRRRSSSSLACPSPRRRAARRKVPATPPASATPVAACRPCSRQPSQ